MNLARGGTLIEHLPDVLGHEDHRLVPGAFGDHDVRLAEGSLAARAAGELTHATKSHHHQGVDVIGDGFEVTGWATVDDLPEALEDPSRAVRAGRAVASGGRPGGGRDRGAGRGGAGMTA